MRTLLEIGAGTGSLGSLMSRELTYVGLEPDPVSYEVAKRRIGHGGTVLPERVEDFEWPTQFDAAAAFEVLEHMEDDRSALRTWQRHVRPGGWLFLSVPAGEKLRPTDRRQGHFRRYTRAGLVELMRSVGLVDVTAEAYGSPVGFALLAVSDAMARRRPHAALLSERTAASGRWMQPTARRSGLTHAVAAPLALLQRPFAGTSLGTGLVARARIPPG